MGIAVIGSLSLSNHSEYTRWLPLFEAFEAGAFAFWITDKEILVATNPNVYTDDQRRLHREGGAAFEWLSDVRDYYWHGVNVLEADIMHPETITVADIDTESNAEVRRVRIERYDELRGRGAYIQATNAKRVASDPRFGTIWRRDLEDDEPLIMIEVINSTAESDGSFKHYFLRVDPDAYHGDAACIPQAAIASTWRRSGDKSLYFPDYAMYVPVEES